MHLTEIMGEGSRNSNSPLTTTHLRGTLTLRISQAMHKCSNCAATIPPGTTKCPACGSVTAPGASTPLQPMGSGAPQQPMGHGAPPKPMGSGAPPQPMGSGVPPQPMGHGAPPVGLGYGAAPVVPPPDTTMAYVLAGVMTFLCCMPGGIVALVLAILASTAVQAGDYNKARSHLVWSYVVSGFSVLGMLFSMIYCAACLGGA